MIKIFSAEKVKVLDQYTITHEPIQSIDLVERAATLFVQEFVRRFSKHRRIFVFAGIGNNGADALAIARLLLEESYDVVAYLFNPKQNLSTDCEENKFRLLEVGKERFKEVSSDFSPPSLAKMDIVIDGLFGTGLNRPLDKGFDAVVRYINSSEATVVSIDMPSGLFGEDNSNNDPNAIIRANLTLTFGFPKLSFLFPENERYTGEWKILDIGIHPDIIEDTDTPYFITTEEDIHTSLQVRSKFAHKGNFGHALLIAGSRGKMGASLLAAKACLRTGAGLLTVHIPSCGELVLQTSFPEAMVSIDHHKDYFTSLPIPSKYTAIGAGPGLGQAIESAKALEELLRLSKHLLVLDADALNIISSNKELIRLIPPRSILTPHPKEFDRLAGEITNSYERLHKAQSFASTYKVCIVLKGAYTAVCTPEENIYFNMNGNPGMATAGSGDVLTGIILGLLAQGYEPEPAAAMGVFLHGSAGDLAAAYHSEESMIAGDIIDMLGKAYKQVH